MAQRTKPTTTQLKWVRVLALVFVVGITAVIYVFREQARELARFGYAGIFFFSILANATIILPAPQLAVIFAMGGVLPPLGVGLAAGLGATLGELSGYLAGFSGQAVVENRALYDRLEGWMKRYGAATIAVLGFLPLPFFDLAGIAAGVLKMPVQTFLFWCAVGKIPKMLLVAYAGAYSWAWVMRWMP
jgi:membrane protein YqaA with SNARE-associated domain